MPSNYTEHYQLNQWEKADKVLMEDFNADNVKLDQALDALSAADREEVEARLSADAALNTALAGHTAQLAKRGNCQIYTTSYTGTGKYGDANPNTLSFPHKPLLVLIAGVAYGTVIVLVQGCIHAMHLDGNHGVCHPTWQGNSVTWFSADNSLLQMNELNKPYQVVALFAMD